MPSPPRLSACPTCDLLVQIECERGRVLCCPRCGAVVYRAAQARRLDESMAFALAALAFFSLANGFPVVRMDASGEESYATVLGAAQALNAQGMTATSTLVTLTTFFIPLLELLAMLAVLFCAKFGRSHFPVFLYRVLYHLRRWSMIEIFFLGSLVAFVKLGHLAHLIFGLGLWSLGAFVLTRAASLQTFQSTDLWSRVKAHA